MNQEQNNINQPMFNVQSNNGTINNQNMSVNPQSIQNQTFGNVTNNNPNMNGNAPKKPKLGLIIGLVAAVVVIVAVVLGIMFFNKSPNNDNKDKTNNPSSQKEVLQSTTENWDKWELIIDGKSITLPMKYQDFINLGFEVDRSELAENINCYKIEAKSSVGTDNISETTYTSGKTNGISLVVYNPSEEEIQVRDSIVIGIEFVFVYNSIEGDMKLINHSKNTEVIFNKSTANDVEQAFGQHYAYDTSEDFYYYPNSDIDATSISTDSFISFHFFGDKHTLTTYGFYYYDRGNSKNIKINKSPEKYTIPSDYELIHETAVGANKRYASDEYFVDTLEYWPFDRDFREIKTYLSDKENYNGKGQTIEHEKYGKVFILEDDKFHYSSRKGYYVMTEDTKYFLEISTPISRVDDKMTTDEVMKVALEFWR